MIDLIIKLKNVRSKIVLTLDNERQVNDFYRELETHDIVKFGPLIFKREEFVYAIMEV